MLTVYVCVYVCGEEGMYNGMKHNCAVIQNNNPWIKGDILAHTLTPFNLWESTKAESSFH